MVGLLRGETHLLRRWKVVLCCLVAIVVMLEVIVEWLVTLRWLLLAVHWYRKGSSGEFIVALCTAWLWRACLLHNRLTVSSSHEQIEGIFIVVLFLGSSWWSRLLLRSSSFHHLWCLCLTYSYPECHHVIVLNLIFVVILVISQSASVASWIWKH